MWRKSTLQHFDLGAVISSLLKTISLPLPSIQPTWPALSLSGRGGGGGRGRGRGGFQEWSRILMHDVEAKNRPSWSRVHLKSFNAWLAVDFPAYSMVISQVIDKLKLVLLFAAQYLTEWVKITIIFVSYGSLALVRLLALVKSDTKMK